MNDELPDIQAGFRKGRGTRDQIPNIRCIMEKARGFQKNIYFSYWLHQSLWLFGSEHTVENSESDGNTQPPDLCPEKSMCSSRSNSWNWIWNNRLVPNWERSTSRLYIFTCLFNLNAEYIMWNAGLDEAQAGIKIARRNINNLRYPDNTTLMAESKEELRASWWKWKWRVKKLA